MLQVTSFQQFHDDVGNVILLAKVVDGDDIGMPETARSGGLVPESAKHSGVAVGDQSLDGNVSAHSWIEAALSRFCDKCGSRVGSGAASVSAEDAATRAYGEPPPLLPAIVGKPTSGTARPAISTPAIHPPQFPRFSL